MNKHSRNSNTNHLTTAKSTMICKALFLFSLIALTKCQLRGYGGHGHAISSQSIVRHETPIIHKQPVLAVLAHHTPIKGHAVSSQSYISHQSQHAPIHHAPIYVAAHKEVEEYAHPAYKFEYSVEDTHTGDQKSQSESRDGDVVKGYYSFLQPDGHIRTVHYEADKHSGFNAHVTYSGPQHHGYN